MDSTTKEFLDSAAEHMKANRDHVLKMWYGVWSEAQTPATALNTYCTSCNWWNQVLV